MADPAFLAALLDRGSSRLRLLLPQTRLDRARPLASDWRPMHGHHLCFVLDGSMEVDLPGGRLRLAPGGACWLPAGLRCSIRHLAPRSLYRLRLEVVDRCGQPLPLAGGPWMLAEAWHLRPLFELAHRELLAGASDGTPLRCLLALILGYLGAAARPGGPRLPGGLSAAQRERVEQRLSGWATMGFPGPVDLARAAGLGHDWFARAFARSYGLPPRRWLADRRLDLAARALESGNGSVASLARRLGYAQAQQLTRQFRRRFGASPAAWRAGRR